MRRSASAASAARYPRPRNPARGVTPDQLHLDEQRYASGIGDEVSCKFITADRRNRGIPAAVAAARAPLVDELDGAAMIREVHVYGQALSLGEGAPGKPQHMGLGRQLIERAANIAAGAGYRRLAVNLVGGHARLLPDARFSTTGRCTSFGICSWGAHCFFRL